MNSIKVFILAGIITTLFAGLALAQDQDIFNAELLEDGTVLIQHLNAFHNCCSIMSSEVMVMDNTIFVGDTEPYPGACWCVCYFDIETVVSDLPAGTYNIQYTYDIDEGPSGETWVTEYFEIVVPEWGYPADPPSFVSTTSECHGGNSVSVDGVDWSHFKSIYR